MGKQGAKKGKRIKVTSKRRKSRQQKSKGARKGKRTTFTHEHRKYVCGLKKAGSNYSDILESFAHRYGFQPHSSSLATPYNDKGMRVYEDLIKRDSLMDSVKTHINSVQLPTMMVDLD